MPYLLSGIHRVSRPPRPRSGKLRLCACVPGGHRALTFSTSEGRQTAPPSSDGSPKAEALPAHQCHLLMLRFRVLSRDLF